MGITPFRRLLVEDNTFQNTFGPLQSHADNTENPGGSGLTTQLLKNPLSRLATEHLKSQAHERGRREEEETPTKRAPCPWHTPGPHFQAPLSAQMRPRI